VLLPLLALVATLATLAASAPASAGPVQDAARYLEGRQTASGGFAEPGRQPTVGLTAWTVIGLRAAGRSPESLAAARDYLERNEDALTGATDLQLVAIARAALGDRPPPLVRRLRVLEQPGGRIGPTVNSTIWGVLALRALREPVAPATVRYLLRQQRSSGGWSWHERTAPDTNDTAAAIQALRAAGVRGTPITRGLAYLRRHQNRDGGFELARGRGSDVQSTAWAIQAFDAAGVRPGPAAFRYLARMRRVDGSYRYSARFAVTPVWVTSQALTALARRPLPLRWTLVRRARG
jgi:hypothetical protein